MAGNLGLDNLTAQRGLRTIGLNIGLHPLDMVAQRIEAKELDCVDTCSVGVYRTGVHLDHVGRLDRHTDCCVAILNIGQLKHIVLLARARKQCYGHKRKRIF